jgi:A/G-specific adenine glycosylase
MKPGSNIPRPQIARPLLSWYRRHRRSLPWRPSPGSDAADPYAVLVSEFMLQQTQVATVVPYFSRFMARYPTIAQLAAAPPQQILRLWQGLGYYSRARNLHAAANRIVADFAGRVPVEIQDLMSLPGVGRYTAGAIASIAFGRRAPILDGNVARVLCRLGNIRSDPARPRTRRLLWQRAEQILPRSSVAQFNSALMDLGATICTPRNPRCGDCPLQRFCRARLAGSQHEIPPPRHAKPNPLHHRWTICVSSGRRWLIERRPETGRWAGLWQFPTIEADHTPAAATLGREIGLPIQNIRSIGQIRHALTHRRYIFDVFTATTSAPIAPASHRRWIRPSDLKRFPFSTPQLKIAEMIFPTDKNQFPTDNTK